MVQLKIVDNRASVSEKINKLDRILTDFSQEYMRGMAESIVLDSPVDTGTYMESHRISSSPQTGSVSSHNKPRNQAYGPIAQSELNRLYAEIDRLEGTELNTIYFSNISEHATQVEYEHGYEVYSRARSKSSVIADQAAARAKARNK
jgi:hypothetical protein